MSARVNMFIFAILFSLLPSRVFTQAEPAPAYYVVARPAQVVVIASQPLLTDMTSGFSPAHLRILLETVHPDIIAVGTPANIADSWEDASLDLKTVVKPWADQRNIPLAPVGYYDADYDTKLKEMLAHFQNNDLLREYNLVEDKFSAASMAHKYSFKFINMASHDNIWRDYNSSLHRIYRKSTPAEEVASQIVSNVIRLYLSNPGKRIAVIINAPYSYYIKDTLLGRQDVALIDIQSSLDFSQQSLAKNTLDADYLYALRILRLDDFTQLSNETLSLLESFLSRIRQMPEYQYDYQYFRGKMLLRKHESRFAASYFQNMFSIDPNILLRYDNKTPVRDSALVYAALARLQMGMRKEALTSLRMILKMPDVHKQTKDWVNGLLAELFPTDVVVELE